jgi:hemin uptake protein HemP
VGEKYNRHRAGGSLDNTNENDYRSVMLKARPLTPETPLAASGGEVTSAPVRVRSDELVGSRGELLIEHNGREYRLRLTQSGKLILTA